ncbi:uncharacterized protein LOC144884402 [Branchiostoma floridae x Branchiostoma japonicum]
MAEASAAKVSNLSLLDKVKKRLSHMPEKDFNVLVVGMPGAGKSSFINSTIMAVTGTWHEVAHYSQSDRRVTKCLERIVMFDDNVKEVYEPHPIPDYKQNVVFWDCAGFNDATEEAYSTIVSLALEGRIPPGTKVVECMNQTPDQLRERFSEGDGNVTFDRIVFIWAANSPVPENLAEAIKTAAHDRHDVPVMVVVTKKDKCRKEALYDLQQRIEDAQKAFDLRGNQVRFKITSLYCEELTPCPDPNDYRVMLPNEEIDKNLLNIWMSITQASIKAKPAPPEPQNAPESSCILL